MLKSDWLLIAEPVQIRKFAFRSAPISHVVDPTGTEDVLALNLFASAPASFAVCEAAACAVDAVDYAAASAAIIAEGSSGDEDAAALPKLADYGLADAMFSSIRVWEDTDCEVVGAIAELEQLQLTITEGVEHPSFKFVRVICARVKLEGSPSLVY